MKIKKRGKMTPLVSSRDIYAKAPLEPIFDDSLNDYFDSTILKRPHTAVHSSHTVQSSSKESRSGAGCCSRLVNTLIKKVYEQSVFFAANNGAIQKETDQNQGLTWKQKIKIGAVKSAEAMLMVSGVLMGVAIGSGALGLLKPVEKSVSLELPSASETLGNAVIGELIFRGAVQNCVAGAQKIATHITPQFLQSNRVFKWLTSPSAKVLGSSGIEAAAHLCVGDFVRAGNAVVSPVAGILYETTGSIMAPIAYSLTNSFVTLSTLNLLKK
jgi:hypothetical protein